MQIFISVDAYLFLALHIFFLMTHIFPGDMYFSGPCFRLPGGLIDTRYRATGAVHIIKVNDKTQPMTMGCDGKMDFHVVQFCLGIHMCSGHLFESGPSQGSADITWTLSCVNMYVMQLQTMKLQLLLIDCLLTAYVNATSIQIWTCCHCHKKQGQPWGMGKFYHKVHP